MLNDIQKIAVEIVQKNFDLELSDSEHENLLNIRKALIDKIDFLLNHDFEKLLSILYRIDVDEEKAKNAMARNSEQPLAELLADLIIERQLEKAKTRINYRDEKKND